jgi:hypothetical protein
MYIGSTVSPASASAEVLLIFWILGCRPYAHVRTCTGTSFLLGTSCMHFRRLKTRIICTYVATGGDTRRGLTFTISRSIFYFRNTRGAQSASKRAKTKKRTRPGRGAIVILYLLLHAYRILVTRTPCVQPVPASRSRLGRGNSVTHETTNEIFSV